MSNITRTSNSLISISGFKNIILSFPLITYLQSFVKDIIIAIMKTGPIPKHIALIMDGNRTYAKNNQLSLKEGHLAGAETLIQILDASYKLGIDWVTIYAFSIENFNRSKEEVDTLFGLLKERLQYLSDNESSYARINKIHVRIIGNKSMIPQDILADLETVERMTENTSTRRVLNVCIPYTGRDDITHSIQSVASKWVNNEISDIDTNELEKNMYFGPDSPPLDIMIRTSGQTRLSDFMMWQCNYNCTVEFVDTLWPDFHFLHIILILLKWGYYKTLEIEREKNLGKLSKKDQQTVKDILKELPDHPPYKSVTSR